MFDFIENKQKNFLYYLLDIYIFINKQKQINKCYYNISYFALKVILLKYFAKSKPEISNSKSYNNLILRKILSRIEILRKLKITNYIFII